MTKIQLVKKPIKDRIIYLAVNWYADGAKAGSISEGMLKEAIEEYMKEIK